MTRDTKRQRRLHRNKEKSENQTEPNQKTQKPIKN